MAATSAAQPARFSLRDALSLPRLRLASGLILFAFALTHFLNHALGLFSIDLMDSVRDVRTFVTRSALGTAILLLAATVHLVLGIYGFITRRSWRIRTREWVQLVFGLLIPMLLARHVIGMRIAHETVGFEDNYVYALWVMWPAEAWRQAILMTLVWVHGTIGLHHWLGAKPWYRRYKPYFFAAALLIPALSFAGFASAGRAVRFETDFQRPFTHDQYAFLTGIMDWSLYGYLVILALVVAARLFFAVADRYRNKVSVTYTGGPKVLAPRGLTVLEISHLHGIPHASVCGGRARCSTCRVRVIEGPVLDPAPDENEIRVLKRVGAPANVRLACQFRPRTDITVTTLLPGMGAVASEIVLDKYLWGVEQEVTILFSDLRGFTKLSEHRLSYDVVFLLNQYLGRMSEAITDTGGYVDKFMGDGIMAIFGMDRPRGEGARQAIAAARAMGGVLDALNQSLHDELKGTLDMGIGIHTGSAILGRIGAAGNNQAARGITALGDTVNTASRLESASKELKVQAVLSRSVADAAQIAVEGLESRAIEIRGREQLLDVYAVKRATQLPSPGTAASAARAASAVEGQDTAGTHHGQA
ncbi:MAG: adenylate/guanylate cyclase domain-containing protein [Parvibaculaceae bacterium]